MDFKNNKPIYKQIIDYCFGNIMSGEWAVDGRVPSIKELSVELAVNNRTVIKAYEYMQMKEIIYVKRGLGYFVSPDARDIIVEERRDEFFHDTLDDVFRDMDILGISIDDVVKHYRDHITS